MPTSPLPHSDSLGQPLTAILSLDALRSISPQQVTALHALGIGSVGDLLHWDAVHHARTVVAVAEGRVGHAVSLAGVIDAGALSVPRSALIGAPTTVIHTVGPPTAAVLEDVFGVADVGALAKFAPFVEAERYLGPVDGRFSELPSAPPELIPNPVGAVTSQIRYSSFIREVDLRGVSIQVPEAALDAVPVADVFTSFGASVIYLGYVAGHTQRWTNLGTHLGEVVHSLPLAPGESRNVTVLDWKRRQLIDRDEQTTVTERIDSVQTHQRALDEVARAVGEEHQYGKSSTESNTAATSGSFVAAGSVVGGVAGGVVGAIGGGLAGLAIDAIVLGGDGGLGTLTGTVAGGAVGAMVGGAAGAAAGGMIYSGASALGLIESASKGDRTVVGDVQQRITASTVQKSSAIRSLWSTIVLEDTQDESVGIRTSNVTNYNHMHAMTVQYYEVLQHYRTVTSLSSVKPLLFLPFRTLDFTFDRIERLWPHLEEFARKRLDDTTIDLAFSGPKPPTPPDVPVLDAAEPPDPATTRVKQVEVRLTSDLGLNALTVELVTVDGTVVSIIRDDDHPENSVNAGSAGVVRIDHFAVTTDLPASEIASIRVSKSAGTGATIKAQIRYTLEDGGASIFENTWRLLGRRTFDWSTNVVRRSYPWNIHEQLVSAHLAYDQSDDDYEAALSDYAEGLVAHEGALAARDEARNDLEQLFRWRRYEFTRHILERTETQQLAEVFDSIELRNEFASIPLHAVAHTIPVGTTATSFVFELKRNEQIERDDLTGLFDLVPGSGLTSLKGSQLIDLATYARRTAAELTDDPHQWDVADDVYLPTAGVFAEAILGRSNSAEKLDITRFFDWQDSPIPNAAPMISAADPNADRDDDTTVAVTTPGNTINLVTPMSFPDPTGLSGVLTAVQNGSMFRDMSKTTELVGVVGHLSQLAGQMGTAAGQMTGQAAVQAMQSATQVAGLASSLAQSLQQSVGPVGSSPANNTTKGATLNALPFGGSGNGSVADLLRSRLADEIEPGTIGDAILDTLGIGAGRHRSVGPDASGGDNAGGDSAGGDSAGDQSGGDQSGGDGGSDGGPDGTDGDDGSDDEGGAGGPTEAGDEPVSVHGGQPLPRPATFGQAGTDVTQPVLGLLSVYLSQYEGDARIPAAADERFRFNAVQGLGQALRHDVIESHLATGDPVRISSLFDRALGISGNDPAVAALLCHNHCRSMGRRAGVTYEEMALGWEKLEAEDDHVSYEARLALDPGRTQHERYRYHFDRNGLPESAYEVTFGSGRSPSAFYLLHDPGEFLGVADPHDWYHFYLTQTLTSFFSSGRVDDSMAPSFGDGDYTKESVGLYAVLSWIVGLMRAANPGATPDNIHYDGWLWANAMSFMEGVFYGETRDQADSTRESRVHRAGALAGIDRTFGITNLGGIPTWRWCVPKASGLMDQVRDLIEDASLAGALGLANDLVALASDIGPFVEEILDVNGDTVGGQPDPEDGPDEVAPSPLPVVPEGVMGLGQALPTPGEEEAVDPIVGIVVRGSTEFDAFVDGAHPLVVFKDEEHTGADLLMTPLLRDRLHVLARLVDQEWPGVRLRVTEAWDENLEHAATSRHYEGRAADLTTFPVDAAKLGRLGTLAVAAGCGWVYFENALHIHVSVDRS